MGFLVAENFWQISCLSTPPIWQCQYFESFFRNASSLQATKANIIDIYCRIASSANIKAAWDIGQKWRDILCAPEISFDRVHQLKNSNRIILFSTAIFWFWPEVPVRRKDKIPRNSVVQMKHGSDPQIFPTITSMCPDQKR